MTRYFSNFAAAMSKRISYTVHGRVQGVFYRATTTEEAEKLGLTGFVQNNRDGTVSGEAQGDPSKLEEFVKFLRDGPRQAKVDKVDESEIKVKDGEKGFSQ